MDDLVGGVHELTRVGEKRPGRGGPKTPEGKERALANLRPRNKQRDYHGVYSITEATPEVQQLSQQIRQLLGGDTLSHLRQADEVSIQLAATALRKVQQCEVYLESHGLADTEGRLRAVAELEVKFMNTAMMLLDRLGLSPAARAKLGLHQAQAVTLAEALAQLEPEKEVTSDAAQQDVRPS